MLYPASIRHNLFYFRHFRFFLSFFFFWIYVCHISFDSLLYICVRARAVLMGSIPMWCASSAPKKHTHTHKHHGHNSLCQNWHTHHPHTHAINTCSLIVETTLHIDCWNIHSTSESGHCNGHVDDQNTKEEEVYQDLLHIQRASRPQVFSFYFPFFHCSRFPFCFPFYCHTLLLLHHHYLSDLMSTKLQITRAHTHTQTGSCNVLIYIYPFILFFIFYFFSSAFLFRFVNAIYLLCFGIMCYSWHDL